MASEPLRIVFVPAERHGSKPAVFGLIGGLVEGLLNNGSGGPVGGSGGSPVGSVKRYPEVAVYNSVGHRHVLEVVDTDEEAEDRAAVIEDDLRTLDTAEWCQRYNVPVSFVEENG